MRVTNTMRQRAGLRERQGPPAGAGAGGTLKSTGWSGDSSITSEELHVG
jgi:hypothetical protein